MIILGQPDAQAFFQLPRSSPIVLPNAVPKGMNVIAAQTQTSEGSPSTSTDIPAAGSFTDCTDITHGVGKLKTSLDGERDGVVVGIHIFRGLGLKEVYQECTNWMLRTKKTQLILVKSLK